MEEIDDQHYSSEEEDDEDDEDDEEEDGAEDERELQRPSWLRPTFDMPATIIPTYDFPHLPEMERTKELNDLVDYDRDLHSLYCNLTELAHKYFAIVTYRDATDVAHNTARQHPVLKQAFASLMDIDFTPAFCQMFWDIVPFHPLPALMVGLGCEEYKILAARNHIAEVEKHLIDIETRNPGTFQTSTSRYERAKCRVVFSKFVPSLKSMHLEEIDFSQDILKTYEEKHRLAQLTDMCPICHEEEGDAVTTKCCKRIFHVSCLLEWMLAHAQNEQGSCPMCRKNFDEQDLAEVLELRTKQLAVL